MNSSGSESGDDDVFAGGLFIGEEQVKAPEYPTEMLIIHRNALQEEGKTWSTPGGAAVGPPLPLYDRFDTSPPAQRTTSSFQERISTSFCIYYRNKRHSLWGHKLWNAAKYLVKRMDQQRIQVRGKTVLELGAGLGVPSLAAYHNGASLVVVTDYPDADLLDIIQLNVDKNCLAVENDAPSLLPLPDATSGVPTSTTPMIPSPPGRGRILVEPLLWGHAEHINKVLSYTNGKGFDIILLSDILFNHVCNDDLASTVATMLGWRCSVNSTSGTSHPSFSYLGDPVAYCVFSHHRAHKQLDDLEFFDKLIAKGLFYELIDQEDYPLMFPEDRGPVEVRQPVKVYRITRHPPPSLHVSQGGVKGGIRPSWAPLLPAPSPLLRQVESKALSEREAVVDVVIQGTSLSHCLLSAALARCGLRVFHCDAAGYYGGGYGSLSFVDFLALLTQEGSSSMFASLANVPAKIVVDHFTGLEMESTAVTGGANKEEESESSSLSSALHSSTSPGRKPWMVQLAGIMVDLLPISHMTRGEVVQQLLDSSLSELMEFVFVDRFLMLRVEDTANQHGTSSSVPSSMVQSFDFPLTRAAIFSASHALLSLMDKRRIMQLVKDINPVLAEGEHAANAPLGDEEIDFGANEREMCAAQFVNKAKVFYEKQQASTKKGGGEQYSGNEKHVDAPTFRMLIQDKFSMKRASLDLGSMFGLFDHTIPTAVPSPSLEVAESDPALTLRSSSFPFTSWHRSAVLLHQLLASPERFGAPTPFIQIKYGVGELSGSMSRIGAVHNAIFALDRSVQRLVVREVAGEEKLFAVMSNNGQHVQTKVVVLPDGPCGRVPLRFHDAEHLLAVEKAREEGTLSSFDLYVPEKTTEEGTAAPRQDGDGAAYSRVVILATSPLFTTSNLPRVVHLSQKQEEHSKEEEKGGTASQNAKEAGEGRAPEGVPSSENHADPVSTGTSTEAEPSNRAEGVQKGGETKEVPPSVVALGRFPSSSASSTVGPAPTTAAVHIVQFSKNTGHIPMHRSSSLSYTVKEPQTAPRKIVDPSSLVLLHFTANAREISAEDLYGQVVRRYFLDGSSGTCDMETAAGITTAINLPVTSIAPTPLSGNTNSLPPAFSTRESSCVGIIKEEDILFAAYFTINEDQLNCFSAPITSMGDVPSETRHTHEYSRNEKLKELFTMRRQQEWLLQNVSRNNEAPFERAEVVSYKERKEKVRDISSKRVVTCSTLSDSLMDDGAPLLYAKKAFREVLDKLGIPMEKRDGPRGAQMDGEQPGVNRHSSQGYHFL